ncbi:PTS sugar transporter subunit IIA [Alicyclobacillaceae bacterium I2511]|jgi:mannose/fructose/sorbose-specific phosphotransferase system IIA component|nr:PTS sugar transporter subunit IIA [Alicyclobacillaceae bacterium I2511]
MIGIILAGHAGVPASMVQAVEMILGEQTQVSALGLEHDTNLDEFINRFQLEAQRVNSGEGVLILCDLFGGSPGNSATHLIESTVHLVCGMNLPMLLEVFTKRENASVVELAKVAQIAGSSGIVYVNPLTEGLES